MFHITRSRVRQVSATSHRITPHGRAAGISLIEVLISLCILAISGLGIASMQTRGIALLHASRMHEQAVLFAQDIAEQIAAAGVNGAAVDITQWQRTLSTALPSGRGEVRSDAQRVSVTIRWQPHVPSSSSATCSADANQSPIECVQWSLAL